jgi:hypothetical protein
LGIHARLLQITLACALVLMCASGSVAAQDAGSNADAAKTTTPTASAQAGAKTEASKKKTSTTGKPSQTHTSGSAKTHSPTRSSLTAHSKSGAAIAHSGRSKQTAASRRGSRKRTARGQQKIDAERAQEIQAALIREHYLTGEADGNWNAACEEAMRKYQADHGWQSKTVPDARALISLGLGPNHDHLLNPESAMTTQPAAAHDSALTAASQAGAPRAATPATPVKSAPTPASDSSTVSTPSHDPSEPQ